MRTFLLSKHPRFQIFFVVSGVILLAFFVATVCSLFFDVHQLIANTSLISSIYQVMGTIYAILLTFTLWGVWQNYTEADTSVQKEAYALLNLVHIVELSAEWISINIRRTALNYVKSVIEHEWPVLKNTTSKSINVQEDSHSQAVKILDAVHALNPNGQQEVAIYGRALALLDRWLDARRTRLLIARGDSARALWPLLFTGALVLFVFHGLFVANTVGIWAILLFGVSLVIGLTFYLIFTLDCPFGGSPSIDSEPFAWALHILANKNHQADHTQQAQQDKDLFLSCSDEKK